MVSCFFVVLLKVCKVLINNLIDLNFWKLLVVLIFIIVFFVVIRGFL